jgi:hypothetical protein
MKMAAFNHLLMINWWAGWLAGVGLTAGIIEISRVKR